ncbi:hypothetical protein SJAG_00575 [Schizosaccharomyces japonicus yFS275]|uniref:Uncharacterized protein n=1 Tax=Schizosaccharomyces japonicus (strain yFS275 / FY16936) TaxID=402676 RepID=B6JW08_SCHJY|nr:hypothetical protein SJAG_00575 [Schizosaccharomyces japonicus yFS275]EEB05559.1 hypothetical protein SJAG_00575 [Schizosaccharomyces japonicus yFS275]
MSSTSFSLEDVAVPTNTNPHRCSARLHRHVAPSPANSSLSSFITLHVRGNLDAATVTDIYTSIADAPDPGDTDTNGVEYVTITSTSQFLYTYSAPAPTTTSSSQNEPTPTTSSSQIVSAFSTQPFTTSPAPSTVSSTAPVASTSSPAAPASTPTRPNHTVGIVVGSVIGGVAAVILPFIILYAIRCYKRKKYLAEQREFEKQLEEEKSRLAVLRDATNEPKVGYRGGIQVQETLPPWAPQSLRNSILRTHRSMPPDRRFSDCRFSSLLLSNTSEIPAIPAPAATDFPRVSRNFSFSSVTSASFYNDFAKPRAPSRRSISYGAAQSLEGRPLAPIPGRTLISPTAALESSSNSLASSVSDRRSLDASEKDMDTKSNYSFASAHSLDRTATTKSTKSVPDNPFQSPKK